jgi:Ca2+-binding EF-hand superfamily protein
VLSERDRSNRTTSSTSDESEDEDTTDEEYFKIIAGDDEGGGAEETPMMKKLRESFENADINMDGTLTLKEFIEMQGSLPPLGATSAGPSDDTFRSLTSRVQDLEAKVDRNNEKLDRILELLVERKGRR